MIRSAVCFLLVFLAAVQSDFAASPPANLVSLTGDRSVILHWDQTTNSSILGYNIYRATNASGPFTIQNSGLDFPVGYCDFNVSNGQPYFYQVTAFDTGGHNSAPSVAVTATPEPFTDADQFLDFVQEANFDFFWYWATPTNGLIADRSESTSPCSIASVGFGLTAIGIAIDHGWISRTQGAARVLTTLNTFLNGPQGPGATNVMGYNGWFYHFLDMKTGLRPTSAPELSSIDTALLLAGVLYVKQYFNETNTSESAIRSTATSIFNRVDWAWMAQGGSGLALSWYPNTGFSSDNWIGYDEAMILYILGLGSSTTPLPASSWSYWTSGYNWTTNWGQSYVFYPTLFTYQYSHCWIDFRHITDSYMAAHNSSYFENSRRASLAQNAYCIANPSSETGYSSLIWGLTSSDDPSGYTSHGISPGGYDDGTIAPTAAGASIAFTPELSQPTLTNFYSQYRASLWTPCGFRDAFNPGSKWFDVDELGIDQGPIVIMIENYRTQRPWKLFMQNPEVQTGLQRAGFVSLPFVNISAQAEPSANTVTLAWAAKSGAVYEVEYSPDLLSWFSSPTGEITATNTAATWTEPLSLGATDRFYRVYQLSAP